MRKINKNQSGEEGGARNFACISKKGRKMLGAHWLLCATSCLFALINPQTNWPSVSAARHFGLRPRNFGAPHASGLSDTLRASSESLKREDDDIEDSPSMRPVGLRRIQRRPELIDPLDEIDADDDDDQEISRGGILERVVGKAVERQQWAKRSSEQTAVELQENSREGAAQAQSAAAATRAQHEFIYVIAPFSEQAMPFERAKVAQGFTRLVGLAQPNYSTGLQRLTNAIDLGQSILLENLAGRQQELSLLDFEGDCRTKRASVRLTRDERHPATGKLMRRCAGLVELNTCEGQCVSSVQPSIRAPNGLARKCACCNERTFRRVQVRLNECQVALDASDPLRNYLDIQVEEPVECKCRACDTN